MFVCKPRQVTHDCTLPSQKLFTATTAAQTFKRSIQVLVPTAMIVTCGAEAAGSEYSCSCAIPALVSELACF